MAKPDINEAIREIVAEEVERSLEQYREMIDRMAVFMGIEAPGRRPGRPARVAVARGPGRPAARRTAKGDVSRFHEGQTVHYRQGRGEFEAKIVKIDADRNMLTVERTTDGKKVERPAAKVYEVA